MTAKYRHKVCGSFDMHVLVY